MLHVYVGVHVVRLKGICSTRINRGRMPSGCIPDAFLGGLLGASPLHPQVHSWMHALGAQMGSSAIQENRVLSPSNPEISQDPKRLCLPSLETFPWEVHTWMLREPLNCALWGRECRVRPMHCYPVVHWNSPLGFRLRTWKRISQTVGPAMAR